MNPPVSRMSFFLFQEPDEDDAAEELASAALALREARIWKEWRELPPIHDDVLGDITPPPDAMEHSSPQVPPRSSS